MIRLKNETDIKYIKKAIGIGESILARMARYIKVGITPKQINEFIEYYIWLNGAKPSFKGFQGFPSASCISINENIIHCVPTNIPLKKGDLVKIDVGINYKGYFSDQARTYIVNEEKNRDADAQILREATSEALVRAIRVAKEGNTIGDISREIENTAKEFTVGILKDFVGHGVGFDVHEEPKVPNRVGLDKDVKLVKGMVIAIEPMFVIGKGDYIKRKDGSVKADGQSAHFERTIIIQ